MPNIVAIVGRPNVGKSTFFNRLIQKREAIVDAESWVTRDRHYGNSDWNGKAFTLIDTGGYVEQSEDIFQKEIDKPVTLAIEEADIALAKALNIPFEILLSKIMLIFSLPIFLGLNFLIVCFAALLPRSVACLISDK